jgi:hypothetical protein
MLFNLPYSLNIAPENQYPLLQEAEFKGLNPTVCIILGKKNCLHRTCQVISKQNFYQVPREFDPPTGIMYGFLPSFSSLAFSNSASV